MKTVSQSTGGQFLIGVDAQPIGFLKRWRERGVNTAVRADLEGRYSMNQWEAEAHTLGLFTIRNSANLPAAARTIALSLPDEADLSNHYFGRRPDNGWPAGVRINETAVVEGVNYDLVGRDYYPVPGGKAFLTGANVADTITVYRWKARALAKTNPDVPLWGNFAGGYVTQNDPRDIYKGFAEYLNWTGSDWYVVNRDQTPPGQPRRYPYSFPGRAAARLIDYSGGKESLAYIELTAQREGKGPWRWPTVAEIACEAVAAIACGASGIIYFPQSWNPFSQDGLGAAAAGLTAGVDADGQKAAAVAILQWLPGFNAQISSLSPYLTGGGRTTTEPAPGVYVAEWNNAAGRLQILVNTNPTSPFRADFELVEPMGYRILPTPATPPAPVPVPTPEPTPAPDPQYLTRREYLDAAAGINERLAALRDKSLSTAEAGNLVAEVADALYAASTKLAALAKRMMEAGGDEPTGKV